VEEFFLKFYKCLIYKRISLFVAVGYMDDSSKTAGLYVPYTWFVAEQGQDRLGLAIIAEID
jgi:hypothetical protein